MPANASNARRPEVRDFTLTRLLNAPRPLVFRAFVEPERMKHWWVPRGFTLQSCALDLREGGAWRMRIQSDETGVVRRPSTCQTCSSSAPVVISALADLIKLSTPP